MQSASMMTSLVSIVEGLEEEPVGHLHDVRLVRTGDLRDAEAFGGLEGEAMDRVASGGGDQALALDDVVGEAMLDAAVGVLDVLTDHVEVDRHARLREDRLDAGQRLEVAEVREGGELLAQRHVDRLAAAADRRAHRPLEQEPGLLDRVDRLVGDARGVAAREDALAHRRVDELEVVEHARGAEDREDRVHDFGTDAVSGSEGDGQLGGG
jgi:hypothetical protein